MTTNEELNAIKEEVETVNKKLAELTEDELAQVTGGGAQVGKIETVCISRNKGTSACLSISKGNLSQCVGCSKNHD